MNENIKQSGFTIIEALLSILILSLALIPTLSTVSSSLDISTTIKNNFIAANLAQEGVEVVRAIRDRNWLLDPDPIPPNPFSTGMIGTWRVEWNSDTLIPVGSNPPLRLDSGFYSYSSGTDTIFRRQITIEEGNPVNPDRDMRIISQVTWITKNGQIETVNVESHLFNWR